MPNCHSLTAKTLIANKIENKDGDYLGHLHDLMLNSVTGDIEYAVLAHDGVLGVGEKFFAVPWHALERKQGEQVWTLDVSKDLLKFAEGIEKEQWPNVADASWLQKLEE
jgi:sporulation protein YlmC with PRC-barrel domain